MALSRKRKKPVPDWIGETYINRRKESAQLTKDTSKDDKVSFGAEIVGVSSNMAVCSSDNKSANACVSCVGSTVSSQLSGNRKVSSKSKHENVAEGKSRPMPLLKFEGSVIYSHNTADCSFLCEDIVSSLSDINIIHAGFDMEWPVSYGDAATNKSKTALIQLCTSDTKCYLFHLSAMGGMPKSLKSLLSHDRIVKYGVNIESDFWKLERDFDFTVIGVIRNSVQDLAFIANNKLKSSERWTLDGLTRNVLKKQLDKDQSVRCGRWDSYPLSEEQIQYAAADAYTGYLLAQYFLKKQ